MKSIRAITILKTNNINLLMIYINMGSLGATLKLSSCDQRGHGFRPWNQPLRNQGSLPTLHLWEALSNYIEFHPVFFDYLRLFSLKRMI